MRQSSALTTGRQGVGRAAEVPEHEGAENSLLHSGFHGSWRNCLARARGVLAFSCSRVRVFSFTVSLFRGCPLVNVLWVGRSCLTASGRPRRYHVARLMPSASHGRRILNDDGRRRARMVRMARRLLFSRSRLRLVASGSRPRGFQSGSPRGPAHPIFVGAPWPCVTVVILDDEIGSAFDP